MAAYDIWIDGVPLNSLASQVTLIQGRHQIPGRANGGIGGAQMNGVNPVMGGFQPAAMTLSGWIASVNGATGTRPAGISAGAQYEANLANFKALFAKPGLLQLEKEMLDGTIQRAWARVTASGSITEKGGIEDPVAQFQIPLDLPYVFFTSPETPTAQTFTGGAGSPWQTVTSLAGSTAPVTDGVFVVKAVSSQLVNPRLETDSGYVQYNGTLASGATWALDAGTWQSRVGTGTVTPTSGGASNLHQLSYAGSANRLLDIWNPYRLRLLGTGTLSGSTFSITARKKYLP